jgi:hypothetical protein
MVTQTKVKGITTRKKLTIISISSETTWGDKDLPVMKFKAGDGEKELTYEIFAKADLIEKVKSSIGQVLECEVETIEKENGFTDRKVHQIFVNGEPVAAKKSFNGNRGKSTEEIASIEQQCAMKMICELTIAGKIYTDNALYYRLLCWLDLKTAQFDPLPKPVLKQETEKKTETLPARRQFVTTGQFMEAAYKELRMNSKEVLFRLKKTGPLEITDFSEAWEILNGRKEVK